MRMVAIGRFGSTSRLMVLMFLASVMSFLGGAHAQPLEINSREWLTRPAADKQLGQELSAMETARPMLNRIVKLPHEEQLAWAILLFPNYSESDQETILRSLELRLQGQDNPAVILRWVTFTTALGVFAPHEALRRVEKALAIADQHGDLEAQSHLLYQKASISVDVGDYPSAAQAYRAIADISGERGETHLQGYFLTMQATLLTMMGELTEAERVLTEDAEPVARKIQHHGLLGDVARHRGSVLMQQQDYAKAVDLYQAAQQHYMKDPSSDHNRFGLCNITLNLAKCHSGLQNWPESARMATLGIQRFSAYGDTGGVGICISELGYNYRINNHFYESIAMYRLAIDLLENTANHVHLGQAYDGLARSTYLTNNIPQAQDFARTAIAIYTKIGRHADAKLLAEHLNIPATQ